MISDDSNHLKMIFKKTPHGLVFVFLWFGFLKLILLE